MKFAFVKKHSYRWPVRLIYLHSSWSFVSGYYAWRKRGESRRAVESRHLLHAIQRIHVESSCAYGSPRVLAMLQRAGIQVGCNRVERLMRRAGLHGIAVWPRRARTTNSRHDLPIASNLLVQDFSVPKPNQVWLADLTYIRTGEGWLYLAGILDACTRKLVGWAMRDTLNADITRETLKRQKPPAGLIHHSDRGIQDAAESYRTMLAAANIVPSISRKGNCWDNAPMVPYTENRTSASQKVRNKNPGAERPLCLYRRLLQFSKTPLGSR